MQPLDEYKSDAELIESILGGRIDDFEILLKRYEKDVIKMLARQMSYQELPELTQDVFVRAYRSLATFAGSCSFKTWLVSIAARACCDHWRRKQNTIREQSLSQL